MIPLRDSTRSNTFPIVTIAIITLNFMLFFLEISLGHQGMEELVYTLGMVPAYYSYGNLTVFSLLPFFTSMFLHGSWMHVIGNMWSLWLFGDNLEDRMGRSKFLLFYLSCGLIAGLTHYYIFPYSTAPVVGASGAIAGVMGAYFLIFKRARVLTYIPPFFLINIPAWVFLGFWGLSQLWSGTTSLIGANSGSIAFWAHIGGFAAGMVLYRFFLVPRREHIY